MEDRTTSSNPMEVWERLQRNRGIKVAQMEIEAEELKNFGFWNKVDQD